MASAVGLLSVAAVAAVAVVAGVGADGGGRPAGDASAIATAGCGADHGAKAPISGLIGISGTGAAGGRVYSTSVSVPWSALQPRAGGPLVHPNAIDTAIKTASQNTHGCSGILVRVLAGINAPAWAKHLGGAPVPVELTFDNRSGTVGRFWTSAFGAAYADLQRKLAASYDGDPLVREVAVAQCTTFYAEPFVRQINEPPTVAALRSAGYTTTADLGCQHDELLAFRAWRYTNVLLALNPYERIDADGLVDRDVDTALRIAKDCRKIFGPRCVLGNNSVRWPTLGGAYPALYDGMRKLGGPFNFQLAAPKRVGDAVAALQWCVSFGAVAVEGSQPTLSEVSKASPSIVSSLTAAPKPK